jgi:hypothetical protein
VSGLKNEAEVGSEVTGLTGVAVAVSAPLSVRRMRIYSQVMVNQKNSDVVADILCKLRVLLEVPGQIYGILIEIRAKREPFQPLTIHVSLLQL